jgi:very-short-patch-repair endonuclease
MRTLKRSTILAKQSSVLALHAAQMRAAPTSSERRLWAELRASRQGIAFRRQVPLLGRFIADFLAPAARLVVEWYGSQCTPR